MYITKQEQVSVGNFYWLMYQGEQQIGRAEYYYGDIVFYITGFGWSIDFDSVSEITPVCLMKH